MLRGIRRKRDSSTPENREKLTAKYKGIGPISKPNTEVLVPDGYADLSPASLL